MTNQDDGQQLDRKQEPRSSVGSSDGLAELDAELRNDFDRWWDAKAGSKEEKEAKLKYEATRESIAAKLRHSANDPSSATRGGER